MSGRFFPYRWLSLLAVTAVLCTAADQKPDKKASQAAFLRGSHADQAGKRDEAIAAYTDAIAADPENTGAMRARAKDYMDAGAVDKALADLEKAVRTAPGEALSYLARGDFS